MHGLNACLELIKITNSTQEFLTLASSNSVMQQDRRTNTVIIIQLLDSLVNLINFASHSCFKQTIDFNQEVEYQVTNCEVYQIVFNLTVCLLQKQAIQEFLCSLCCKLLPFMYVIIVIIRIL